MKTRNHVLAKIQAEDPTRLRSRTVPAKKGQGRKVRPRKSNRDV